jgi:hypothetical protein
VKSIVAARFSLGSPGRGGVECREPEEWGLGGLKELIGVRNRMPVSLRGGGGELGNLKT